jgi:hypothetical protein
MHFCLTLQGRGMLSRLKLLRPVEVRATVECSVAESEGQGGTAAVYMCAMWSGQPRRFLSCAKRVLPALLEEESRGRLQVSNQWVAGSAA